MNVLTRHNVRTFNNIFHLYPGTWNLWVGRCTFSDPVRVNWGYVLLYLNVSVYIRFLLGSSCVGCPAVRQYELPGLAGCQRRLVVPNPPIPNSLLPTHDRQGPDRKSIVGLLYLNMRNSKITNTEVLYYTRIKMVLCLLA